MKNKYSITYVIVSCVALFLFYETLVLFLHFHSGVIFLVLYGFLLICSILIAFGKLKSNIYSNLGVSLALFIGILRYLNIVLCPFYSSFSQFGCSDFDFIRFISSMQYFFGNILLFLHIIPVSIVFLIVGIFKGRVKSIS